MMNLNLLGTVGFAVFICTLILWRVVHSGSSHKLIHGPPRDSLIAGNLAQLFSPDGMKYHELFIQQYGNAFELHGLFQEKQFFLSDSKAISAILNNQDLYHETNGFKSIARLIFGSSVFAVTGHEHRKLRKSLNPVFAMRHIRALTGVFYSVAKNLQQSLAADVLARTPPTTEPLPLGVETDIYNWLTRTALDVIGFGGIGYDFGALAGTDDPYSTSAKHLLPTVSEIAFVTPFLHILLRLGPAAFRRLLVFLIPLPAVQRFRAVVDTMDTTANQIYKEKKSNIMEAQEKGEALEQTDVMSLTVEANLSDHRLTDEELVAQMSSLIFAALDTTSGAMSRTLELLATHPEIQNRLRKEITSALIENGSGDLDFDKLSSLKYLNAVCSETLRLHPPVSWMSRTSQADSTISLSTPVKSADGRSYVSQLPIPSGTTIYLSIFGVNRDKTVWGADADEFRPERWLSDEKGIADATKSNIMSSILSFSAGPRSCIGYQYGLLEMKVVLSVLLHSFKFEPTQKEVEWHLSLTQSPHIKGDPNPSLPLVVSIVSLEE